MAQAELAVRRAATEDLPRLCQRIREGDQISAADRDALLGAARAAIQTPTGNHDSLPRNGSHQEVTQP